jgi:hypothetical protein
LHKPLEERGDPARADLASWGRSAPREIEELRDDIIVGLQMTPTGAPPSDWGRGLAFDFDWLWRRPPSAGGGDGE